ncbi:MAG: hypothetical protein CM1200mP30_33960 [Pseudomonadota bacterium]|nr:MAG: hypothetical protein CM1200mP30_33960 [Pseudomonadota bacterium]
MSRFFVLPENFFPSYNNCRGKTDKSFFAMHLGFKLRPLLNPGKPDNDLTEKEVFRTLREFKDVF